MPISHISKVFGTKDCGVTPLLTDPAGGSATYGTKIDVPGIKKMGMSGDVNTNQLRGDNTQLDQDTVLGGLTGTVEHAKLSLDVIAAIVGGSVADSGTTPAQKASYSLADATITFPYFKIEGQAAGADIPAGDAHFLFFKCRLTSWPDMGTEEEDYRIVSFEFAILPRIADAKRGSIDLNETAVAIV